MSTLSLDMKVKAIQFRQEHRFAPTEPIKIGFSLSKLGVLAAFKPLGDSFSGMAIKENDIPAMVVNSRHPVGRQHFTVCHELYHLFVQEDFSSFIACKTGVFPKNDPVELAADYFASHLLLPEEGVLSLIPPDELGGKDKITLATLLKIEHYYSCSRAMLLRKLKEWGFISSNFYDIHSIGVKLSAITYGYSKELYEPGNEGLVVGGYGELANFLYDNELISESNYLSLMLDIGKDIESEKNEEVIDEEF